MPFASPSVLFLTTANSPERSYARTLLGRLRERGYTRFAELCCGAYSLPMTAVAAGWPPVQIECSDVSLYSAAIGSVLSGADLGELGVRLDGELVALPDSAPADQAAFILWLQLLVRMQVKSDVTYWRELADDLTERADEHQKAIAAKVAGLAVRLRGAQYRRMDLWDHLADVADDEHTIVSLAPPTYLSGYEKFYDTKGRLTWDEPEYRLWDPETDLDRLHEFMADKPALLLCSEQREPGHAVGSPVYARHLALGQYVYLTTNHPEIVLPVAGGPKVYPRRSGDIYPADVPVIDPGADITAASDVQFLPVKADVADWYRGLWMHRLTATPGSYNLLVVIDGKAAGVLGYSVDPVVRPYSMDSRWGRHMLLRFAFGAPHEQLRLGRLMTMLAIQKGTVEQALTKEAAIYLAASDGICTVNYTRHPESKFYRGLMKLAARQDHPDGYKLTYAVDWSDKAPGAVMAEFLAKEAKWRASRQPKSS